MDNRAILKESFTSIIAFFTSGILCACATNVELTNVEVRELEKLDSDYQFIPEQPSKIHEGELSGQAISDVRGLENKKFWEVSFSSTSDLKAKTEKFVGIGLSYWISPCDKSVKPNDSRYSKSVLTPISTKSNTERYFVFIPKSLRKAMHSQSSTFVASYRDYMKEAVDSDKAEDLCLFIGAHEQYTFKKFTVRVGSLEELGISLD